MNNINLTERRFNEDNASAEHELIISSLMKEINAGKIKALNIIIPHPDDMIYGVAFFDDLLNRLEDDTDFTINVHVLTDGEAGRDITNPYYDSLTTVDEGKNAFTDMRKREEYNAWSVLADGRIPNEKIKISFHGLPDSGLSYLDNLNELVAEITAADESSIGVTIDNSEEHQDHLATLLAVVANFQDKMLLVLGTKPYQHQAMVASNQGHAEFFDNVVAEYRSQFYEDEELPESITSLRVGSYYSLIGRAAMLWQKPNHTLPSIVSTVA
ncbi:PIG-L family deacetylase [Candidatus Saccharibacteria bacterium]|nr:PIG-L family deacetylase [Candidatus Saccharibacteria bacterium]